MSSAITRGVPRNRDSEIGDSDQTLLVDEHVGWLEIAMKDALGVSRRQSSAKVATDIDHLLGRQTADSS